MPWVTITAMGDIVLITISCYLKSTGQIDLMFHVHKLWTNVHICKLDVKFP